MGLVGAHRSWRHVVVASLVAIVGLTDRRASPRWNSGFSARVRRHGKWHRRLSVLDRGGGLRRPLFADARTYAVHRVNRSRIAFDAHFCVERSRRAGDAVA